MDARLSRIEFDARPARGRLEALSAERVRYVADRGAEEKELSFTIVAHTADKRQWRIAVDPRPGVPGTAVAARRVSLATRGGEPVELTRSQLAGETAFDSVQASQTIRGGRVEVQDDGTVRFTPRSGFRGVDQFVCTLLAADGAARERDEAEVDDAVEALSSLMEPIIMVVQGTLIGGMVIAMYLPIFKMGSVV